MKNILILRYNGQGETGKVESQRKDLPLNNNVSIVEFSASPNKNLIKGSFMEVE